MSPLILVLFLFSEIFILLIILHKEILSKISPNKWIYYFHLDSNDELNKKLIKKSSIKTDTKLDGISRIFNQSNQYTHKGCRSYLFFKDERFPTELKKGLPERNEKLEEKMWEVKLNDMLKGADMTINDFFKKFGLPIAVIIIVIIGVYFLRNANIL